VEVEVPPGWECRIRRAAHDLPDAAVLPVLHAATVPLSSDRADYGGGVVEKLTSTDVFVSLIEMGEDAAGTSLYPEVDEIPTVSHGMFQPFQLQRRIKGQAGTQIFFTYQGRAFCMYVVIGSYSRRVGLAATANLLIERLDVVRLGK
jgi:hypothetical protein